MVFGPSPVDPYGWEDKDEDSAFAQDTSLSGQFVQQWRLRMMAQEAARQVIANSRLRRLLASNKSFTCTDEKIGDTTLSYKVQGKKSPQRWRGRP